MLWKINIIGLVFTVTSNIKVLNIFIFYPTSEQVNKQIPTLEHFNQEQYELNLT